MAPDDSLPYLLMTHCDLCGREFAPEEEFYRLQRLQLVEAAGGGLVAELVSEVAMCAHDCGGQEVVKI